jgi:pilus assembly protein CpaE
MSDEGKIRVVIVDDITETRENIRKLLQFEADVEVVGVARTGQEGIEVTKEMRPDVVLMDINMPDMDGITATEKIRAAFPATQIVILSVQSDSNYMRRAMLAGARDFLTKPPDVDELTAAIRRAGVMAKEEQAKAASTMAAVQAATTGAVVPGLGFGAGGKVVTIYSPKGGTGSTTVTANLAVALHSEETPVAVVDAKLQFGDLSFFFNEQGRNNVMDLVFRDTMELEIVKDVMISHETTGIEILAAPPRPEQAESISSDQFARIIQFLKGMYSYLIIDTDSSLNDVTLGAIDSSDLIVLITTQDIPSIKNVRLFLDLVDALGLSRLQIMLMMNKVDKRRNITPDRVKDIAKQDVVAAMPLDERMVVPAMDRGVPFMINSKNDPVSREVQRLAGALLQRLEEIKEVSDESLGI